jgi:isopenicillin N synthase-like dioxygenase
MALKTLPLVDLAPFRAGDESDRRRVARTFGDAFETTGFAVIVHHGVPEPLARALYDNVTAFFALSTAEKLQLNPPERTKGRGYLPLGIESVAKTLSGETPPDLCEALVFNAPHRPDALLPKPNLWPDTPPALSGLIRQWSAAMVALTRDLMRLSALALDLPEDYFAPWYTDMGMTVRFVNYPDQPEPPRPGQLRYGAHHDYGGLTILRQDRAPGGLEVCDSQGQWHEAGVVDDSFVINVGDLMSRWTNGRWRSTLHRVSNPDRALTGSTRRLSMVAFGSPNEAMEVACLPTCHTESNPPRFPPVAAGAYILGKLAESMDLAGPA